LHKPYIMFATLDNVCTYYKRHKPDRHEIIYKRFEANITPELATKFNKADGFGELAFCWNWRLLVQEMPTDFKFLEVGVYKGRVLALIQLYATELNKNVTICGVTPLTSIGDKYSSYDAVNYIQAIEANFATMDSSLENTTIVKGLSTDLKVQTCASGLGPFDIIYIDGGHDYETVCKDIETYLPMLKKGGYLILDDASLFLENPFGRFLGHEDVCRAIKDTIDNRTDLTHLYAVGHNRVWKNAKRVTFSELK
jgi:Methyltransferase domain